MRLVELNKQKLKLNSLLCIVSLIIFSGCTVFTPPLEKPVIENKTHNWFENEKTSVFSTTASRRSVIVSFPDHIICAEAPPDVADSFFSSLELALNKSENPEFSKDLLVVVNQLFKRSQGAQIFRDGAFHLCQAYQNEIIDKQQYNTLYTSLVSTTSELVVQELFYKAISKDNSLDLSELNQSIDNFNDRVEEIKKLKSIVDEIVKSEDEIVKSEDEIDKSQDENVKSQDEDVKSQDRE